MTQREVFGLLGAPQQEFVPFDPGTFSYNVGRYYACPATSLIVSFDSGQSLARFELIDPIDSCRPRSATETVKTAG